MDTRASLSAGALGRECLRFSDLLPSWVVHRDAGPVAVAIRIVIVERLVKEREPRHIANRERDAFGVSGNR